MEREAQAGWLWCALSREPASTKKESPLAGELSELPSLSARCRQRPDLLDLSKEEERRTTDHGATMVLA